MTRVNRARLARDIEDACTTLAGKGGARENERRKIVIGPGH
jgi:glutamate decarboxylase